MRSAAWSNVEASFERFDLSAGPHAFEELTRGWPLRFDIVLYLGIHHHLMRQMEPSALAGLLTAIISRCAGLLAIRVPEQYIGILEGQVLPHGFERISLESPTKSAGMLGVYSKLNTDDRLQSEMAF